MAGNAKDHEGVEPIVATKAADRCVPLANLMGWLPMTNRGRFRMIRLGFGNSRTSRPFFRVLSCAICIETTRDAVGEGR